MTPERRNYILGAGEQLVETVPPPARAPIERSPYSPTEARNRLLPRASRTSEALASSPREALPGGEAVAALTLHPQYLSKSAFPAELLAEVGLRAIGSRPERVIAEQVARKSEPVEEPTSTLFVAGTLPSFDSFAARLQGGVERFSSSAREELTAIEDFRPVLPEDRISEDVRGVGEGVLLECVLHTYAGRSDAAIVEAFASYAASLGLRVDRNRALFASGLCFLSVSGDEESVQRLAWFSFLRRIRPMPRMRPLLPTPVSRSSTGVRVQLPDKDAIDPSIVAAVFDAALPNDHALGRWVKEIPYTATPFVDPGSFYHGLQVSSAAAFGPLDESRAGIPPFSIEHHGVLGEDPDGSGYHAALQAIQDRVKGEKYPLFNLSFGPEGAISDSDVDPFTSVIDELLADGEHLAFVAVGNDGDLDDDLRLNRIQSPSDAANAIAVGAANSRMAGWDRADYSCVGPGRLGCMVKPDVVAFGGSLNEPFGCVGPGATPVRENTAGTSFASPSTMRMAGLILSAMGDQITLTGLRALLLHESKLEDRNRRHVGHGLIPADVQGLLSSSDNEVKVLFQGNLNAGKYVRHEIPMIDGLEGMIELEATLCYASPVDPNFPTAYVRAGIDATFRPHSDRRSRTTLEDGSVRYGASSQSEPLFNQSGVYGGNTELKNAHLWDTALKTRKRKRATSYKNPAVDLHYNRRVAGQVPAGQDQPQIPYALVLTLRSRADIDLYNQIRTKYGANLRVLTPRIEATVRA